MRLFDKLIFVSRNDTATGPMAKAIMEQEYLLEDILIESKGLVVLFPEPINQKAEAVLASKGLSQKGHVSDAIDQDDFDERTLILTMSMEEKGKLLASFEAAVNVYTLKEYVGSEGDVTDPYGGDLVEYGRCFEELQELTKQLMNVFHRQELMLDGI